MQWLQMGPSMYRQAFVGEPGKYVLADLRKYAFAESQQCDILEVVNKSREELVIQATRVAMFRRIMLLVELTEDQIDAYERRVRENLQGASDYE